VACVLEDCIQLHRNPAILPAVCEVKLAKVDSALTVGEFGEVNVVLENVGHLPISRVKARLTGEDRISSTKEIDQQGMFLQGDFIDLRFFVKAIAAGPHVPLELNIALEDDAGPPAMQVHFDLDVQSRERQ
jgi:hypothetical protein